MFKLASLPKLASDQKSLFEIRALFIIFGISIAVNYTNLYCHQLFETQDLGYNTNPNKGDFTMMTEGSMQVKRWSTKKKFEVVLRLFQGELIDEVSREVGVEPWKLEEWKQKALDGMESSLKEHTNNPLLHELNRAKKQIGELSMEAELLREKVKKQGPLVLRRSSK